MNAFEAARQKHAKNLERRLRSQSNQSSTADFAAAPSQEDVGQGEIEAPEQKPKDCLACIITIHVQLPDGEFDLKLIKPAVYQNATRAKLNKNEFKNRITEGLRPLLGGVNELPGGC